MVVELSEINRSRGTLFDGDQVTLLCLKNSFYFPYFMPLIPTYAFIDRADGRFSRAMDFKKDYAALIAAAWEIDSVIDDYLTNPEASTLEMFNMLGLDEVTSQESFEEHQKAVKALYSTRTNGIYKGRYCDETMDGFTDHKWKERE